MDLALDREEFALKARRGILLYEEEEEEGGEATPWRRSGNRPDVFVQTVTENSNKSWTCVWTRHKYRSGLESFEFD